MKPDISTTDFIGLEHSADQKAAMRSWSQEQATRYDVPPPFSWGDAALAVLIVTVVVILFASLIP